MHHFVGGECWTAKFFRKFLFQFRQLPNDPPKMIFEPFVRNALRLFGQICSKGRQKFDGSDRIFVAQNNFGAVETDGQNSRFRFQSFGIEKLRARKNKILKENTKQFKLGLEVSTFVSVSCHDQDRHQILLSLGVSICLDVVSIETLDLDISKTDISTLQKWHLDMLRKSRHFKTQVLTVSITLKYQEISIFVKILIETLDLDISKTDI